MIIALCGYMGCGKSTIGKNIANLLYAPFVDLDEYICKRAGKSIPEIFAESGESAFRALEQQCLEELLCKYGPSVCFASFDAVADQLNFNGDVKMPDTMIAKGLEEVSCVLSVGGGTPVNPTCAELLRTRTLCFYLKTPLELIQKRLWKNHSQRPLLAGKSRQELNEYVSVMMAEREPAYLACSHQVITAENKSLAAIALEIANF